MSYYFLNSLFEDLSFEENPSLDWSSLQGLLEDELSVKDYEKVSLLRNVIDIESGITLDQQDNSSSRLFLEACCQLSGFLGAYFTLEKHSRLILAALRAKALNQEISVILKDETAEDFLIEHILGQRDNSHYNPPIEYQALKEIMTVHAHQPLRLHRALGEWKVKMIQQLVEGDLFGIDRILGYLAQYFIIHRWHEMQLSLGEKK
jgi:hypothetical protein